MGQWIQEGERSIFETVISIEEPNAKVLFPHDEENLDGLNFLAGKRVDEVNKMAELGTRLAHVDGGVPNIRVSVPKLMSITSVSLFISSRRPAVLVVLCKKLILSISQVLRHTRRTCLLFLISRVRSRE